MNEICTYRGGEVERARCLCWKLAISSLLSDTDNQWQDWEAQSDKIKLQMCLWCPTWFWSHNTHNPVEVNWGCLHSGVILTIWFARCMTTCELITLHSFHSQWREIHTCRKQLVLIYLWLSYLDVMSWVFILFPVTAKETLGN